jgi:hypothetical chaperone protein
MLVESFPRACGLDFGTSNSTLAVHASNHPTLLPLEGEHVTIPSAVFFGTELHESFLVGRAAMGAYVEGSQGRLMRSLKSILGSSLIDERTQVYRRRIAFADVIGLYVSELKRRAEAAIGHGIDSVVHGRPVHFVDNDDEADRHAETALRAIATKVGFKEISFQYEPVAAAFDFERQIDRERVALIADIGGGTSDFTVVRLSPARHRVEDREADILANDGLRLGGTDYDRYLSMAAFMPALGHRTMQKRGDVEVPSGPYWDLSTWSSVHHLYDPKRLGELKSIRYAAEQPEFLTRLIRVVEQKAAHSVLIEVEAAKIDLSDSSEHESNLDWIEPNLKVFSTRGMFEQVTQKLYDRLKSISLACVKNAGLAPSDLSAVFFTGGTSLVPSVRRAIAENFPDAEMVDGDRFGSVGLGLAIEAKRRYG